MCAQMSFCIGSDTKGTRATWKTTWKSFIEEKKKSNVVRSVFFFRFKLTFFIVMRVHMGSQPARPVRGN